MRLTKKAFLSDSPDETGFIVVTAESPLLKTLDDDWSAKNSNVIAEVQIGDCSKKIYLDFSVYKDSDVQRRIDKLNVLIGNLQELKDALPSLWCDAVKVSEEYNSQKGEDINA